MVAAQVLQAGGGQEGYQILQMLTMLTSWILFALMVPWALC